MVWTPKTDRVQLYSKLQPHNSTTIDFIWFLNGLYQELQRKLVVVWDRLGARRKAAHALKTLGLKVDEVRVDAPVLTPVDHVWSIAKWGRL